MSVFPLKTFVHPNKAYQLEYPSHWDQLTQKEGADCGFGPHDRNDVGLWISILPMSIDTDRLIADMPKLMKELMEKTEATNARRDESMKHACLKSDCTRDGQGGHYWLVAGGDLVLFASTQVPVAERDAWNPQFDRVMASLQITREKELLYRQVGCDVLQLLREKLPDEEFEFDDNGIRGKHQSVNLGNVYRQVKQSPKHKAEIIKNFVAGLTQTANADLGYEEWDEIRGDILPMLKPKNYINPETATRHLHSTEWLADIIIVYVIKNNKFFRFITGWDINHWGKTPEELHQLAIENLSKLPWPHRLEGSRNPKGGRVILVDTPDSLASSRLLHPDFHRLFSGPLGSPFWAGIPCRDTLVAFSDRRHIKQRIRRSLAKDYKRSAAAITPRPFLVTADGIAVGEAE